MMISIVIIVLVTLCTRGVNVCLAASPSLMWLGSCHNVTSNFSIPSSGGQYEAIGCRFAGFISINTTSPMPSSKSATVVVSNGFVVAGTSNGFGIDGPLASNALTMGPLHITVRNMTFGQDAALRFTGALPPSSSLVMTNNSFYLLQTNGNAGAIFQGVPHIAAIILGDFAPLQVFKGSSLIVSNNNISASYSGATTTWMTGLFIRSSQVILLDNASLRLSRNAIKNTNSTTDIFLLFWRPSTSISLSIANSSSLIINDNVIGPNVTAGSSSYVVFWRSLSGNLMNITNNSSLSVTNNSIENTAVSAEAFVIFWHSYDGALLFSVVNGSSLSIAGNSIRNTKITANTHVVCLTATSYISLDIINNSYLSVDSNRMLYEVQIGSHAYVVYWYSNSNTSISISNGSMISISCNSFENATVTGMAYIIYSYAHEGILLTSITENSSLAISSNYFVNTTVTAVAYIVRWYVFKDALMISVTNNSSLWMNENALQNSTVLSSSGAAIIAWESMTQLQYSITNNSCLSLSRNGIVSNVLIRGPTHVIYWRSPATGLVTVADSSSLSMNDNYIRNNVEIIGSAYVIYSTSKTVYSIAHTSILSSVGNTIRNNVKSSSNSFVISWFSNGNLIVSIFNSSSLVMSNNSIADTVSWIAHVLNFNALNTIDLVLANLSSLSMGGNSVWNTTIRSDACYVIKWTQGQVTIASSILVLENNWLYFRNLAQRIEICILKSSSLSLLLLTDSLVSISNNTATIEANYTAPVISIGLLALSGINTSVLVTKSSLNLTSSSTCPQPALAIANISAVAGTGRLLVTDNTVNILTVIQAAPQLCPSIALGTIHGLSHVILQGNRLLSDPQPIQSTTVSIPVNGTLTLRNNVVMVRGDSPRNGSFFLVAGVLSLGNGSLLVVKRNIIVTENANSSVLLTNAFAVVGDTSSSVVSCGNTMQNASGSMVINQQLSPPSLVQMMVGDCTSNTVTKAFTATWTWHPTASMSKPLSESLSRIRTSSRTLFSVSKSQLRSPSPSTLSSASQTFVLITPSLSLTVNSTSSGPISVSHFKTLTRSQLLSASQAISPTATPSTSATCDSVAAAQTNDTCSVFRPMSVDSQAQGAIVLDSTWLLTNDSCTLISVPFSAWTGRRGATHKLGIVFVDSHLPLRDPLGLPGIEDTYLVSALPPVTYQVTVVGQGIDTRVLLAGTIILTYIGQPTLNRIQYKLNVSSWTRCSSPVPGVFEVTLLGSERLLSVEAERAVSVGSAIVSAGAGLTVSPTAVAQMSVASSLRKMSRCATIDLDVEGNEDYAAFTSGVLNPFGMAVGGGGGRRYLRGTLVMSAVYFALFSCLMLAFTTCGARVARLSRPQTSETSGPLPLLSGFPSALVAVVAFVLEGAVGAGVVLGVAGSGWGDALLGWVAVLLCAAFVGSIVHATVRAFPTTLIPEQIGEEGGGDNRRSQTSAKIWLLWLSAPTHRWGSTDRSAVPWMGRYESYIADARVAWYCGLEQGVALLVCVFASLPVGAMAFCVARGVVCVVLLGVQSTVMVVLRPPVHRWRWLLLSMVLVLQTVVASLSAANAPLQDQQLELAMDVMGMLVFVLASFAAAVDLLLMAMEVRVTALRYLAAVRRGARRSVQSTVAGSDPGTGIPLLSLPLLIGPPTAAPSAAFSSEASSPTCDDGDLLLPLQEREERVVNDILQQLALFELQLRPLE